MVMNSRLDAIADWEQRAAEAQYCVAALARNVDASEEHLRRVIHERFRQGVHEWLTDLRMCRAVALLAQGKRVKDIAVILGFDTSSSFGAVFHQRLGCTPREYLHRFPDEARRPRGGTRSVAAGSSLGGRSG